MADSGLVLSILYAAMERLFSVELVEQLRVHQLSRTQYKALRYLRHREGSELASLAEMMEISAPAATKLADRMEKGGWVLRGPDQGDKRRVVLTLTEQARGVLAALDEQFGKALARVYDRMSASDQQRLLTGAAAYLQIALEQISPEKICLFCGGDLHDASCPLSSR